MKTESKVSIVGITLLALMVWPLLHRYLVVFYNVDPWRFGGWAMYCDVHDEPTLQVTFGRNEQASYPGLDKPAELETYSIADLERLFDRQLCSTREFHHLWAWGSFATPHQLAGRLFEAVPQANRLRISVRRPYLSPADGRIYRQVTDHDYTRQEFALQ